MLTQIDDLHHALTVWFFADAQATVGPMANHVCSGEMGGWVMVVGGRGWHCFSRETGIVRSTKL